MTTTPSTKQLALPTPVQRALRTAVSAAVGFAAAELIHIGIHIPAADEALVFPLVTGAVTAGYNALALWAEKKWKWADWMLLKIGSPS